MTPSHLSPILDEPTLKRLAAEIGPHVNGRKGKVVDVAKMVAQVLTAALLAYTALLYQQGPKAAMASTPSPADDTQRIAVLEQRVNDIGTDLREIRSDVKELLQRAPK